MPALLGQIRLNSDVVFVDHLSEQGLQRIFGREIGVSIRREPIAQKTFHRLVAGLRSSILVGVSRIDG